MTGGRRRPTVVIALGGHAMTAPDGRVRPIDQIAAINAASEPIAAVVASGASVVVTHGNGPQVGNLLVKNEMAATVVPPVPLDWCGAQTQGTIGAMLVNAIEAALSERGLPARVAALVSRTRVDPADERFTEPSKPIGRYVTAAQARLMMAHGQVWQDRGAKGWRRVVASPEPLEILDAEAVEALLSAGFVVIASGGGGIPVARGDDGRVRGVEAVVDKDLSAAMLAKSVGATVLVIATDVDGVAIDFGTPGQRRLGVVDVAGLRGYARAGQFATGSMLPKVEAACRFLECGGDYAVITTVERIADAVSDPGRLAGEAGTVIAHSGLSARRYVGSPAGGPVLER